MKNLYCFKHPEYRGEGSPILSCKTCCSIFISLIKEQNASQQGSMAPRDWIAEKARKAQAAYAAVAHITP